eukprot:scaffold7924_cov267-Pinguiococcus_pyrenoidosus.AAC.4
MPHKHGLGEVDDVQLSLVKEEVVLAEIRVDQVGFVPKAPDEHHGVLVVPKPSPGAQLLGLDLLQLGRRPPVVADEFHQKDVLAG